MRSKHTQRWSGPAQSRRARPLRSGGSVLIFGVTPFSLMEMESPFPLAFHLGEDRVVASMD